MAKHANSVLELSRSPGSKSMLPARGRYSNPTSLISIDTISISRIGRRSGTARVRATPGWHGNTVRRHMMRGQLRGSKSARDIHAIVVAAQHQVLPEEEILNEVVRLD